MALRLNDRARNALVSALDYQDVPETLEDALGVGMDHMPRDPELQYADFTFHLLHDYTEHGASQETVFAVYGDIVVGLYITTPDYCDDEWDAFISGEAFPSAELNQRIDREKEVYVEDRLNEIEHTMGSYGLELANRVIKNRINHLQRGKAKPSAAE